MKPRSRLPVLFLLPGLFLIISALRPFHPTALDGITASPTPTYDPLVEPPLPPNPSEFDLGRNLYWHRCMPCHGDRGQGLTDEFRSIWEPDHQDCWARGCHSGRPGEEGFPVPTVVPALVVDDHLARFASVDDLDGYLHTTHPPQSPGILKAEEYHAIAIYVLSLNGRSPEMISPSPTPSPVPVSDRSGIPAWPLIALIPLTIVITFIYLRASHPRG